MDSIDNLEHLPAQTVAICGYLEPLLVVLFSVIILQEKMLAFPPHVSPTFALSQAFPASPANGAVPSALPATGVDVGRRGEGE